MTEGFNYRKTTQSLNFFALKEGGTINKMKALKLIWLADRFHVRKYGKLITNDTYFAFRNGPVASGTRDLLESSTFLVDSQLDYSRQYIKPDGYTYETIQDLDSKVFSKADLETLDLIYNSFGNLDQFRLSNLSHESPEWKKFEIKLNSKSSTRFQIEFSDFFKNPQIDYNNLFNQDEEYLEQSKEVFLELQEL